MTLQTGERVLLRRMLPKDLEPFCAYRADPDVARFQSWEVMDEARAAGFLAHCASVEPLLNPGQWCQVAVADLKSVLLGDMGLFLSEDGREAEIGITLAQGSQGKGLGLEAMLLAQRLIWEMSAAEVIWAITDVRNTPSLKLIERAGFTFDREEQDGDLVEAFYCIKRPS